MTDRYARLIEQVLDDPGTVLLLGSMDSGKTTFARALLAGAVDRGIAAAYLDTDVGRTTVGPCLLYTSPSPRDSTSSRMPSSA